MSINGKHAYRFGYLKSSAWQNVRLEALAREGGKCQICGQESLSNDGHHIWYPENIYETKAHQVVILCRPCHDFCHAVLPDCKTKDRDLGWQFWIKFRDAAAAWRLSKVAMFNDIPKDSQIFKEPPAELRQRLKDLKAQVDLLREENSALRGLLEVAPPDFQI